MLLFQNNRQGAGAVWIGQIRFRSDCPQKECQLNMQLQKYCSLWFQLNCGLVLWKLAVWREKLYYLLQSLNSWISV